MSAHPLVSPAWLQHELALGGRDIVVADVRWYLSGQRGRDAYAEGHLPSAHFIDLDAELASPPGSGRPGRHPLPEPAAFAALLTRLGVGPHTVVIGYDDAGGAIAARLWWLLDYFGHDGGRVLDGGIQAWKAAGYPLETTLPQAGAAPSPVHLVARHDRVADRRQVAEALTTAKALAIDARARERYLGQVEPIDARPGHVPGAVNVPFTDNLQHPGGPFREPDDLVARYRTAGVTRERPTIVYCGSGVTACHDVLALRLAGHEAILYEGSWSDWAADPSLPAATGE